MGTVLACFVAILMITATTACGAGDDDDRAGEAQGSPPPPPTAAGGGDGAVRTRKPLTFRPVQQTLSPAECRGTTSPDTVPSHDRSACFRLGEPVVVVTRYGAKVRAAGDGSIPDAGAVDVTLDPADLDRFNELAAACFERTPSCPTGQLAVVFADEVRMAPAVQEPKFSGALAISGSDAEIRELLQEMDR